MEKSHVVTLAFFAVVAPRAAPDADEAFLDRILGVAVASEDAHGEGKALAMVAVVQLTERILAAPRYAGDYLVVFGELVLLHGTLARIDDIAGFTGKPGELSRC